MISGLSMILVIYAKKDSVFTHVFKRFFIDDLLKIAFNKVVEYFADL